MTAPELLVDLQYFAYTADTLTYNERCLGIDGRGLGTTGGGAVQFSLPGMYMPCFAFRHKLGRPSNRDSSCSTVADPRIRGRTMLERSQSQRALRIL